MRRCEEDNQKWNDNGKPNDQKGGQKRIYQLIVQKCKQTIQYGGHKKSQANLPEAGHDPI